MFVMVAGPGSVAADGLLERLGSALRGGNEPARLWRDPGRNAGAAALAPDFLPEDAHDAQPIVAEDRLFVCQARLDNRDELIELLAVPPQAPLADSRLLALAYDRWGADCVHRLAGDFAFAAWHRGEDRIVAALDPLGARRLYWARAGNGIALAAQLPALLAHPQVSQDPDLRAIARLLDAGIDRTTSPFAAVRSLPGGHILAWRRGEVRVERWWQPDFEPTVWHRDPQDYVEELRELFTRAVQAQLRSSSPVSTTLSGGLDSSCVTAMAARLLPDGKRLAAYTSVPEAGLLSSERPNWEPDDSGYAGETARLHANIDHRLVAPSGRSVLDASARVHERSLTPVKSATNLLWIDRIGELAASAGSRVLLVGQHGNAAFSARGENPVGEMARLRGMSAAWAQARTEARGQGAGLGRILARAARDDWRSRFGRPLGSSVPTPARKYAAAAYRSKTSDRANEYALVPGSRRFWAMFATTARHAFWAEPVLQWGIEWRDPTADRRLIERLLRFPQAAFRTGGLRRGLARSLAKGLLSDAVRLRRTQGAQVPEAPSLIARHAGDYWEAIAGMRRSPACREFLDLRALDRGLESFVRGSRDYGEALALDRAFNVGMFLVHLERRA